MYIPCAVHLDAFSQHQGQELFYRLLVNIQRGLHVAEGEALYVYEEEAMLAEKENSVWKVQEINIFKSINKYVKKKLNINFNIENSYLRVCFNVLHIRNYRILKTF